MKVHSEDKLVEDVLLYALGGLMRFPLVDLIDSGASALSDYWIVRGDFQSEELDSPRPQMRNELKSIFILLFVGW